MQGDTAGPNPLARPDPMRWIRRGLAALLLLTLIAAAVLAAYAWRTLPPHEGTLALAGARGEIRIERDAGRAAGYFHFSSADYAPMTARFAALGRLPDDPALGNWVKRKDLAGYESYTSTDAAGTWLLMCAQNKGRCYFRRTD